METAIEATSKCTIHIFRDSPLWETVAKWFMLRKCDLLDLYLGTVSWECESGCEEYELEQVACGMYEGYPGCVLVY